MKFQSIAILVCLTASVVLTTAAQSEEIEQLKTDLIGHTMGGRDKCWKFQSASQIRELTIKNKTENEKNLVYSIHLKLQDSRIPWKYDAEAQVVCEKVNAQRKIRSLGLISLVRSE